ncbi:MAG: hypothetical protein QJR02_07205 [Sinobacteraceae bacterium]|nr:hypothetical protein [Nevskiaceae bacterium]
MSTPFNIQTINVGDLDYPAKVSANFVELATKAVNVADIQTLVSSYCSLGGNPALIGITSLNNGTLPPLTVAGRNEGSAAGAAVDAFDLSPLYAYWAAQAWQDARGLT